MGYLRGAGGKLLLLLRILDETHIFCLFKASRIKNAHTGGGGSKGSGENKTVLGKLFKRPAAITTPAVFPTKTTLPKIPIYILFNPRSV